MRFIIVFACSVLLCVGCDTGIKEGSASDINVVAVIPLTGSFQTRGEMHLASIQKAIADLEAEGDLIAGRRVRIYAIDSTSDKVEAERRLRERMDMLAADGKTVAALFSSTGAGDEAASTLALERGIPKFEISSGSYWDEFVDEAGYPAGATRFLFTPRAICYYEAILTADFIASRPEWSTVYLMRGTGAHDVMHTATIRERLTLLADATNPDNPRRDNPWTGTIVNAEDLVMAYEDKPEYMPWRDHLTAVQAMSPDVMFFHLRGDSTNFDFLADAKAVDFRPSIVTCGMVEKPELLDPVAMGTIDYLGNRKLWFVTRGPIPSAAQTQFRSDLTEFSGDRADSWGSSAYDAMFLVGLAIISTGDTNPAALRDAIEEHSREGTKVAYGNVGGAVELARTGVDLDYDGASGSMDFRTDDLSVPGRYWVDEVQYTPGADVGSYSTIDGWVRTDER